jgi:hypothetical protein
MLRDGRLGDLEFALEHADDAAGRCLANSEQLEDPAANRVGEDLKRVHPGKLSTDAYISQG